MNMTIEQITAAYPNVAKLESQAGRELLAEVVGKMNALAAENAGLKAAFEKPDAWLSWHSIPPTFYEPDRGGEYLQVHEQAGEKNDDGSDSWPVYRNPETGTTATDDFLAEVRASGVEMCSAEIQKQTWDEREGDGIVAAIDAMEIYAAQLRQGAAL